jgi:hypothetical protein
MTEQTQDVPAEVTEEPKAPPTPSISAESKPESSAKAEFNAEAFEERFKQLEEAVNKLPDLVDARFKSTTDKSFQDVRKVAKYLEQFGGDVDKAVREMAIDEMIEQRSGRDSGKSSATVAQAPSDFDKRTAEILEEAGIPLDDPELVKLSETPVASAAEWYRKITRLGVQRAKQGNITPAAVVGSSGKVVASGDEQEALLNEMNDFYAGKHGSLSLPQNTQRLKEIAARLNEIDPPKPIG